MERDVVATVTFNRDQVSETPIENITGKKPIMPDLILDLCRPLAY